ncbi:MAG: hypothetical protein ACO1OQ_02565 [Rufibacter sp.]
MPEILRSIYLGLLCLLVLYTLFSLRSIKRAGGLLLAVALFLSFLVDGAGTVAKLLKAGNKAVLAYNLYNLLIFPTYLHLLGKSLSKKLQKAVQYVSGLFLLAGLGNLFFGQGMWHFNHFTLLLGAAILVFFTLLYFKSRFDNPEENLLRSWRFWVATGLLMYFPGTLLYFGFMHYLNQLDPSWLKQMNMILQIMNIVLYSLFGVALLCLRPRQKLSLV